MRNGQFEDFFLTLSNIIEFILLKWRWMDTILSLYNESLMDFSVRGKSSTTLESHIEKPH